MSFASTPLPKLNRNLFNPLSNIKTLANDHSQTLPLPTEKVIIPEKQEKSVEVDCISEKSKQKEHPKGNILHVSNICPKLTYEQIKKGLYNLFSLHGPIFEIIIKTKESGQHFAFVDYPDIKHAEAAWKTSRKEGKKLENRLLVVNYCEDPKKNIDRKDQKCFLCHGTGHKAIKCPVKPEMIKRKPKKIELEEDSGQQQTNLVEDTLKLKKTELLKKREPTEFVEEDSSDKSESERDQDYLKFLKLKKVYLERKIKKKMKEKKKSKYH